MKENRVRFRIVIGVFLFGLFAFVGCSTDDDTGDQTEDALVANAGTNISTEIGDNIQLNGSESNHSGAESFEYSWEFSTRPENSASVLVDANSAMPSFRPDVVGEYTITLRVFTDTLEDTDMVTVTVTSSGQVLELGGNIREDIVLTNRVDTPGIADYCVTSNINLDAVMRIEPGVEIHFEADLEFRVSTSGVIIAEGTPENHIVFTAKNQDNPWRGVGLVISDDVRNVLNYVDISYAGSDRISLIERSAGLGISGSSELTFTNSTITHSSSMGMYIENGGELINFANNSFSNNTLKPLALPASQVGKLDAISQFSESNGDNSIEIHNGRLTLDAASVWPSFGNDTPYHVTDDIDVDSELSIMPGAVFMFDADLFFRLSSGGVLIANGTAEDIIQFTARDQSQAWRGIGVIFSSSIRNSMDYVEISYGGLDNISIIDKKAALGIASSSKMSFTNSKIINSASNGMFVEDDIDLVSFENNIFLDNMDTPLIISADSLHRLDTQSQFGDTNGNDYIEVLGASINFDEEVTWNSLEDDTPYVVSGNLSFSSGVTIAPKATFLMQSDLEIQVRSDFLSAKGGSEEGRITFTAFDTSLPWRGIAFLSDNVRNELDYVEVSYGGSDFVSILSQRGNVMINSFDQATITNSNITNSVGYGVVVDDGATVNLNVESNNTFSNNTSGTVFFEL